MRTLDNFKLLGMAVLLAAGLAACNKQPGPAETAGKAIDQTAADAGKKIGETAEKMGDKMSAQGEKTAAAIDDATITTKVKAAILAEPGLKTLQIGVETVDGVVTLSGSVDSQANSEQAKTVANAVSGVRGVDNKLVVKSS